MKKRSTVTLILIVLLNLSFASCKSDSDSPRDDEIVQIDIGVVLTEATNIESTSIENPPAPKIISITDSDINSSSTNPEWQELLLFEDDQVESAAISPNGNLLAVGNTNEICLFQLANASQIRCLGIENSIDDWYQSIRWSSSGTHLAYFMGHRKTIVHIWNTITGELLLLNELEIPTKFLSKAWSMSGESLAIGNSGGGLWIWEVDFPGVLQQIEGQPWSPDGLLWKPNGDLISVDNQFGEEGIWNVTTEEFVMGVGINADTVNKVIWAPNLNTLAFFSPGYGIRVFNTFNGELLIQEITGTRITWSPKEELIIISLSDNVVVWDLVEVEQLVEITGMLQGIFGLVWSVKGDLLAFADNDGTLVILETVTWSILSVSKGNIESIKFLDWAVNDMLVVGGTIDEQAGFWIVTTD